MTNDECLKQIRMIQAEMKRLTHSSFDQPPGKIHLEVINHELLKTKLPAPTNSS